MWIDRRRLPVRYVARRLALFWISTAPAVNARSSVRPCATLAMRFHLS
jgi:hypothetical protein